MKLKYDMMKMQQDRQREEDERAEKQRREECDFQLRLFGMMYPQSNTLMFTGQQYSDQYYYQSNSSYSTNSDSDVVEYQRDQNYPNV